MQSKGLGNEHGQGEAGIGVPVWCCTECNNWQDCTTGLRTGFGVAGSGAEAAEGALTNC